MDSTNEYSHDAGDQYQSGDVIGHKYEIHRRLGKGGFGLVYLAYNRELDRVYALKTFRDEFLDDSTKREMFKKEALLWIHLDNHPFILRAKWVEEISGRLFVVMEHIAPDAQGRVSLRDHLAQAGGPIETNQMLIWAIQFCFGMEHANAHGIKAHRDIKPANILITQDRMLKIADFGLAAAAEMLWQSKMTEEVPRVMDNEEELFNLTLLKTEGKKFCGTPGYIAPEVYEGKGANVHSDIYGLGLVLWQMAAGSRVPPFHVRLQPDAPAQKYQDAVYQMQKTGKVPLVDTPVKEIIDRCLAFKPSQRYVTFSDVRAELELVLQKRTGLMPKLTRTGKESASIWNNKAASFGALGMFDDAIKHCDRALKIDPQHVSAWNNKGYCLHALSRDEEAITCYDKSLEIDPRYAAAWSNKGKILSTLGRHEAAIPCLDRALELDPHCAAAYNNKGISLCGLGRREEGIRFYEKALVIDPRFADPWRNKALAQEALGHTEEAVQAYKKFLELASPQQARQIDHARRRLGVLEK